MLQQRSSSRDVARRIDGLASGLRRLARGVADEVDALRRDLEGGAPISLPQFGGHLRELEDELGGLGCRVEALEASTLGSCSLQEMVGHAGQAYMRAIQGVADLEAHLRNYGYVGGCPALAPSDPFRLAGSEQENVQAQENATAQENAKEGNGGGHNGGRRRGKGGWCGGKRPRHGAGAVDDGGIGLASASVTRRRRNGNAEDPSGEGKERFKATPRTPLRTSRQSRAVGAEGAAAARSSFCSGASLSIERLIMSPSLLALTRKYAVQSPEVVSLADPPRDDLRSEGPTGVGAVGGREVGKGAGDHGQEGLGVTRTPAASRADRECLGSQSGIQGKEAGQEAFRASGGFGSPQYTDSAPEGAPTTAARLEFDEARWEGVASIGKRQSRRKGVEVGCSGQETPSRQPPSARRGDVTFTPRIPADQKAISEACASLARVLCDSPPASPGQPGLPAPSSIGARSAVPRWATPLAPSARPNLTREVKPSPYLTPLPMAAVLPGCIESPRLGEGAGTPLTTFPSSPPHQPTRDAEGAPTTPASRPTIPHADPCTEHRSHGVGTPGQRPLSDGRPANLACNLAPSNSCGPPRLAESDLSLLPAFYRGMCSLEDLNSMVHNMWEVSREKGRATFTPDSFIGFKSGYQIKLMLNCLRTLEYVVMDFDNHGVVYKLGPKLQG
eukprot:evm.model.scf_1534.1 EVM.evm.TU.scf_1534.1   scf_1534:3196-5214(-)